MTHAEILAGIAHEVVEQYRNLSLAERIKTAVEEETVLITEYWPDDPPAIHPSWNYTLPLKYQG